MLNFSPPPAACDVLDLTNCEITRASGEVIRLTPDEAVILGVLAQAKQPNWKATQTLAAAIYGGGEWRDTWHGIIRRHIHHLRKKIKGGTFSIMRAWSLGYRIVGDLRVCSKS